MCLLNYSVSKHALNRVIERLVLSQNIKLNKRQLNHYRKRAKKKIHDDLKNMFAISYSNDGMYKYIYTSLTDQHFCNKYVFSKSENCIVTVLNDINLLEEIKIYNLTLLNGDIDIKKVYSLNPFNFIYTEMQNENFIFVLNSQTNIICSSSLIKGDVLC